MPYLSVSGTTVEVSARDGVTAEYEEVGDRERAFDGTLRSTVRAWKRVWPVVTIPITRTAGNALVTKLQGTPPLTCSGDLLGAQTSCHARSIRLIHIASPQTTGTNEDVRVSFDLLEE